MNMKACFLVLIFFTTVLAPVFSQATEKELVLKDNLKRAHAGDYLVTAQNKNYTILWVRGKEDTRLTFEEITVPMTQVSEKNFSWRRWLTEGSPGQTCRVMYTIDLATGSMQQAYSYTKNEWVSIPQSQNFMATLLNLQLRLIPQSDRKKVGPPPPSDTQDRRSYWQPKVIVDGKEVEGVAFEAWKTRWPKDGSDLAGKVIEIYVPRENEKYPSYFPYWLQVSGIVGKAKVRIVDSGSNLFEQKKS